MGEIIEIAAGEFKAKCLKLMDAVQEEGTEFVITKRGKPVAKLVPIAPKRRKPIFGCMKGRIKITGDIMAPLDVKWNAMKDPPCDDV